MKEENKFCLKITILALVFCLIGIIIGYNINTKYYTITGTSEEVCGHIDIIEGVEYCSVSPIPLKEFSDIKELIN